MSLDEKLIATVEKYPVLYDNNHKYYYDTKTKENVWDEIAQNLNENVDVLRKKWTSFRDCFRKFIIKRKSKSVPKGKSAKLWKYEEHMSFLKPHLNCETKSKKGSSEQQNSDENSVEEPEIEIDESSEQEIFIVPIEDHQRQQLTPSFPSVQTPIITRAKRARSVSEAVKSEPVAQTHLEKRRKLHVTSSASASSDHLKSFFKAMEDTVRTFSPILQVEVKSKISSLIAEFEVQHLTSAAGRHSSLSLNNDNSNSASFAHVECSPQILSPTQSAHSPRTEQAHHFEQLIFNQLQRLLADYLDN